MIRLYHKLYFTRQFGKAHDLAEYLRMLTNDGIVEIDAKGAQTKASRLIRELAFTSRLKSASMMLVGLTKSLLADVVLSPPPLYSKQKALR